MFLFFFHIQSQILFWWTSVLTFEITDPMLDLLEEFFKVFFRNTEISKCTEKSMPKNKYFPMSFKKTLLKKNSIRNLIFFLITIKISVKYFKVDLCPNFFLTFTFKKILKRISQQITQKINCLSMFCFFNV